MHQGSQDKICVNLEFLYLNATGLLCRIPLSVRTRRLAHTDHVTCCVPRFQLQGFKIKLTLHQILADLHYYLVAIREQFSVSDAVSKTPGGLDTAVFVPTSHHATRYRDQQPTPLTENTLRPENQTVKR